MRLNWPELDFAYKPCFLGRPRRGKIRNCPSPSSLRNQASRRNDIPDYMTRAKLQNPHAKVAKIYFTWRYSHFKLQLQVLYQLIRRLFRAIGLVKSGEGLGIFVIFVVLYAIYLLLFELFLLLLFIYIWNILAFCHLSYSFKSYSLLFKLVFNPFLNYIHQIVLVFCNFFTFIPCFLSFLYSGQALSLRGTRPLIYSLFCIVFTLIFPKLFKLLKLAIYIYFSFLYI